MVAAMRPDEPSRSIGDLTFLEIARCLRASSVLCMPIGSIEQHGPHLPLNTDVVLSEEFTRRIIARWGETFDLWQLPTLTVSLAREHDWAPGTLSLSIHSMTALVRDLGREIVRSLPARNLAIINGHGGNRGFLKHWRKNYVLISHLILCASSGRLASIRRKGAVSGNSRWKKRNVNDARDRAELGTAGSNWPIEKLTQRRLCANDNPRSGRHLAMDHKRERDCRPGRHWRCACSVSRIWTAPARSDRRNGRSRYQAAFG